MSDPIARMPYRVRLPLRFDVAPLAADVAAFAESDWSAHFVRDNFEGRWSVIPLRAAEGDTHATHRIGTDPGGVHFVNTHYLGRAPALRALLAGLDCPLKTARLMRLTPGSRIKEHDAHHPDAASGTVCLQVPITTNDEVEFLLNRRPVLMAPGELWYLRLSNPHAVANRGVTDRVHLVVEVGLNAWLIDLLRDGARKAA
jgi:hypothetical protein